jgi:uncharacterized membrane protein YkoI
MYKPLLFAAGLLLSSAVYHGGSANAQDSDTGTAPNYQQPPTSSYPEGEGNGQQYNQDAGQYDRQNQQGYDSNRGEGYPQANREGPLPQQAIEDMLRRQNFGEFRNFESKGNVYKVTAVDQRGQVYRLSVDAYTGRIIEAKRKES